MIFRRFSDFANQAMEFEVIKKGRSSYGRELNAVTNIQRIISVIRKKQYRKKL